MHPMSLVATPTELISLLNDKLKTKYEQTEFLTHVNEKENIQPENNIAFRRTV